MQLIPIELLEVRSRQRTSISTAPLNALKESILGRGLLQPPVARAEGEKFVLVVGERRLRAIELIYKEKSTFSCDGAVVPSGQIPVLSPSEYLDAAGIFEAELDENLHREELSWQDRCAALAALHEMKRNSNPGQTLIETAESINDRREASGQPRGNIKYVGQAVKQAVVVAEHLSDPKIASARNANEAYALILKGEEERLRSIIARRTIAESPSTPQIEIRHGDSLTILPKLPEGFVDLILTDPPYGVDASGAGFRSRTVHHHNYDDTMESARAIAQAILTEGFRICKPRANLLLFTDIKHWEWLQSTAANMGWTPFRTPIIWQKSESEGLAPWGGQGPRRTYDVIFYATKGARGMVTSPTDIWTVKRVSRSERLHAAEKPVELLIKAIECTTLLGDFVLDPCCGSGSSLVACRQSGRRGLGIEKDETFYHTAMANVHSEADKECSASQPPTSAPELPLSETQSAEPHQS